MIETANRKLGCLPKLIISLFLTVFLVLPVWYFMPPKYIVTAALRVHSRVPTLLTTHDADDFDLLKYQRLKATHAAMLLSSTTIASAIEQSEHYAELATSQFQSDADEFAEIKDRLRIMENDESEFLFITMKCPEGEQEKAIEFLSALIQVHYSAIRDSGTMERTTRIRTLERSRIDYKEDLASRMKQRGLLLREIGVVVPGGISIDQQLLQKELTSIAGWNLETRRQRLELERQLAQLSEFPSDNSTTDNGGDHDLAVLEFQIGQYKDLEANFKQEIKQAQSMMFEISGYGAELDSMEQDIAALKKVIERLTDELQFANLESSMEKRQVEIGFLPTRASRATDDKSLAGFVVFALTMFSIILILISLPGWIRRMRRRKEVIASRPA